MYDLIINKLINKYTGLVVMCARL